MFHKKLKVELPAFPLVGIYLEKNIIQKDTCTPMLIVAQFTIVKAQEQPKYPFIVSNG